MKIFRPLVASYRRSGLIGKKIIAIVQELVSKHIHVTIDNGAYVTRNLKHITSEENF